MHTFDRNWFPIIIFIFEFVFADVVCFVSADESQHRRHRLFDAVEKSHLDCEMRESDCQSNNLTILHFLNHLDVHLRVELIQIVDYLILFENRNLISGQTLLQTRLLQLLLKWHCLRLCLFKNQRRFSVALIGALTRFLPCVIFQRFLHYK